MRGAIILLGLVVLAPLGCDDDEKKPRDRDEFTVQVEDPAGAPLAGAAVTTEPATQAVTAGADGRAVFLDLEPGTYLFRASLAGRQPKTISVVVPDGDASTTLPLVTTDGLVAWYPFDGDGTDAAGDHDATAVDASAAADRFGRAGLAYAFDGATDHLTVPGFFSETTAQLTLAAWVKPATITGEHCVLYNMEKAEVGLYLQADRITYYFRTGLSSGFGSWSDPVVTAGAWQHIALTRAGGAMTAYHDGAAARSIDTEYVDAGGYTGIPGAIGYLPDGRDLFEGAMEDVQVYSRPLSAAEIAALARR